MTKGQTSRGGFLTRAWKHAYKTSAVAISGKPVDILHDFYIPVLRRSVGYDRVAGYFRSTSLAAASQGFSAFVGREGRMRLIVGADLAADDVRAILDGDAARLTAHLRNELDSRDVWPQEVANGVELLAWMVAHGHLEARVAFRVHAQTGDPLNLSATEDGYVHEKWGVFTDESGNRIHISGSLNESKTALTLNAESISVHCDWKNDENRQRCDEAEADFEALWEDTNPSIRVLPLPEAVRRRLIDIAAECVHPTEIDGTSAAPKEVPPPSDIERLRFAILRDGPKLPGGRFVGMETAPVAPWPHQQIVARRLIETWPYSYLLCDEVGLGKTIEAGLAIRSLYLSGIAKRILITCPASLTAQWQREMASKFLLRFARALSGPTTRHAYLHPFEEEAPAPSLYAPDLAIVSTGLLSRREREEELSRADPIDIALVDEAHFARRKNPTRGTRVSPQYGHLYRRLRDHVRDKARSLWLVTATPMQLDPVEVCDLLALTNRVGAFQFDPTLTLQYYEVLGQLVQGAEPAEAQWEFVRRAIRALDREDPLLKQFVERSVIDGRTRRAVAQWLDRGRIPKGADRTHTLPVIFAASPLSRVMLRHTRPLLEIYREKGKLEANLAHRQILPVPTITMTDQEREAYEQLQAFCEGLAKRIDEHSDKENKNSIGFLLSLLRLRFASSLYAIRETLKRRTTKVEATLAHHQGDQQEEAANAETLAADQESEDDHEAVVGVLRNRTPADLEWELEELGVMSATLADISSTPSKMQELLKALDRRRIKGTGRIEQTVVFTRFYDTLVDIVRRLRIVDRHMLVGTYSGKGGQYMNPRTGRMTGVDREEVRHRFLRGEIDVLVCTDAAAEGLNLQTADLLINFDLPWNPMKVEQRIGRIDRIGQKHEQVYVLNLCYVDSAEQIVYDRLLRRLAKAGAVVGSQQVSMLPVTTEEFQLLAEGRLTEETLARRAEERIDLHRQRAARMEIPAQDLYDIYVRLAQESAARPAPVDLEAIWRTLTGSQYLRDLGCLASSDPAQPVFTLSNVADAPDKTALTVSRRLYEDGVPGLEGRLHFAAYGDPFFDAILDLVGQHELPRCACRLVEAPVGLDVEVVAYAVACYGEGGKTEVRLVTSSRDLEDIQLDHESELTDELLEPARAQLREVVRQEFEPTLAVGRLERTNVKAAHAQLALDHMITIRRFRARKDLDPEGDNFWVLIKEIEGLVERCEHTSVSDLPADRLRAISKHLLFGATIPTLGSAAAMTAPQLLMVAAVEAALREVDGLKVRRSEMSVARALARLDRAADRELRAAASP